MRHTPPALPKELWAPSLSAVWNATAAIFAANAPIDAERPAILASAVAGTLAANSVRQLEHRFSQHLGEQSWREALAEAMNAIMPPMPSRPPRGGGPPVAILTRQCGSGWIGRGEPHLSG